MKTTSSRSSRSSRSTTPTSSSTTSAKPLISYGPEFPSWLPEDKKQDIIDLQVKTLNSPPGRIRRPRIRKRDPNHVPRPMNSFLSYRTEQQHFIRHYCPGANHREISKIVAKWWHELNEEGKELYREQAISAKLKHAERYPDYKFTPKKKKNKPAAQSSFKVIGGKKMITEEVLYTNIHEDDLTKELSTCKYDAATIDPAITTLVHSANYPNPLSFEEFMMNTYPALDEKTLTLLEPFELAYPDIMPVMPTNGIVNHVGMEVDPTLYPEQTMNNETIQVSDPSTQDTPVLDYSESPVDACLASPSTSFPSSFPSSFPLSGAYAPQYNDYNELFWQY